MGYKIDDASSGFLDKRVANNRAGRARFSSLSYASEGGL